ncbi:MAG: ABC transporter substrate-binding protein [Thermomicrobiales bacterium]|nr:ABC transporter substrate-binding protein [Thermomicrobiales bacterium]
MSAIHETASRFSRRAIAGSAIGLAATSVLGALSQTRAQEATPAAQPAGAPRGEWTEPEWSPDPLLFNVISRTDDVVTIETPLDGTLEFPSNPQRVVAMQGGEDMFITFGYGDHLVNIASVEGNEPAFVSPQDAARFLTNPDLSYSIVYEPDVEAILALQPDLIFGPASDYVITDDLFETLSGFAPVLRYTVDDSNAFRGGITSWGAYFGLEEMAAEAIAAFDDYVARGRAQIAPYVSDQNVAVFFGLENPLTGWGTEEGRIVAGSAMAVPFYRELGLRPTGFVEQLADEEGREGSFAIMGISLEQLGQIDADVMFVIESTPEGEALARANLAAEVLRNVPAIQQGQAYVVSMSDFGGGYLGTARAVQLAVEVISRRPLI